MQREIPLGIAIIVIVAALIVAFGVVWVLMNRPSGGMGVKYYIGKEAIDVIHDLILRETPVITTERFRRLVGVPIPSRGMFSEPEFIVDAYRNEHGKLVLVVIDRSDENAFLEIPEHSQYEIARELSKPEWGMLPTLARSIVKSVPMILGEMALRAMITAALSAPETAGAGAAPGAVAGAATGLVSGLGRAWGWFRRARLVGRMARAAAAGARAVAPILRYGATDVLPTVAGWAGMEYAQIVAQPGFVPHRGYLPAIVTGGVQGILDVGLRRYLPMHPVTRFLEPPIVGSAVHAVHGIGGMALYATLLQR